MRYVFRADVDYGRRGMAEETMIGESLDELAERLTARGQRLIDARVSWYETISLWQHRRFPSRELAQIYRSLSRRMSQGAKPQDALAQAGSFVSDPVLKVALSAAGAAVTAGARMDEALHQAGFDEEDIALVRAMSEAGNLPEAFQGLSDKHQQLATLGGKIKGILTQPIIYGVIGALMIWSSFLFLIPRFATFFQKAGFKPPHGISQIYALDAVIQQYPIAFSVLYWTLLVIVVVVLFSGRMREVWRRAPVLRQLLARADAAQALTSFALLYEAAIRRSEAARRVATSCRGEQLREAFNRLASGLEGGGNPSDAARLAEFPEFLSATIIGALGANDPDATVEDLRVYARIMAEDVEMFSKRFETWANLMFMLMTALMVLGIFGVTVFPELATLLSHA
ncbi:hypothetical protein BI364_07060 [Acidihalobacter yilgarnensis]|uniref:Type II secretion system protein GspF domain-containing protein n=1 Tax=Acidihalobacter yilgarnensis TaxID=2819280 RepID=A0A1D8IMV6_9GAMM|nr:type II secretion system F family protein [Acidihalobacter yilgarnensis]AOU97751.1 hypothetical protein BI364_07060 [Acidihalobacter yilgarnensis]